MRLPKGWIGWVISWLLIAVQVNAQTIEIEVRRNLEYVVHDGVRLAGNLYVPKTEGRYPAIVAIHGGGWQAGSPQAYQYWGPYLAQRGIAVYAIAYRFSKPGQKSFPEAVHDVRAAVQFLRGRAAELRIDPDRIGLMGDSAGGHLAALVALAGDHPQFANAYKDDPHAAHSTKVKVAVPIYGVFDMYAQWKHDQRTRPRDHITEKFLGASAIDDKRVYFDASPLSYVSAKNNSTSFLVVWGTVDDIVDKSTQSETFLEALKQAGHFVRPVPVEGAPHFWAWDPIHEDGSFTGFLAPRLLRFLQLRL